MLQVGHTILHYRILANIGQGGMGEVYKAEDLKLGRSVAIKVLPRRITKNEDARRRLISEARAASALNHPNIVTIHSIEEWQGIHFIVMEYIEGESLGAMIKRGPLPVPLLLDMGSFVAEALAAAHAIGVIHRDIKPGNIMLTENGRAKLLDFGLAKRIESTEPTAPSSPDSPWQSPTDLTEAGRVMGTITYMSTEQTRGEALDGRTDIFSLGCVLYEAATDKLPFPGPTIKDVMYQIVNTEPIHPSVHRTELPQEFDYIIARTVAKQKESRYSNAGELADALKALRSSISEAHVPENPELLIAVLYFENLSGSREEEYFRDGMTEDIIFELSKIKDLRILPRSAVVAYRDKAVAPQQIGRQLRASFLLVGSVRREGVRVRITAQLLDAKAGHAVWSQRYDREVRDILAIQEEIARSIVQALRITLSPQEEKAIANKPVGNPDAYDYYLRGRNFMRRATHADLEFAMQMFDCAIALEKFALAYAGLASVCALFYDWYEPETRWIEKGLAAANSCVALDPQLAECLAACAGISWSQRKYEDAIYYARLAIDRKPDCEGAYWVLLQALFSVDRWQEVEDLIAVAVAASGNDYNIYVPLLNTLGRLGKTEEAQKLRQAQTVVLKEQLRWVPEDVRARILLAVNHAFLAENVQAVQELQKAVSLRPQDANLLYNAACTYGVMGMKEEAFSVLRKAVENGYWNMDWIVRDPDLTCLHGDPAFQQFLEEHKRS
jgi:non-specific serine/threonine protein kinase